MSRRLRIESGSSPMRISIAGVDAVGANFDQVVFDANQAPLRLWTKGYVAIDPIPSAYPQILMYAEASSRPTTPAGKFPLFAIMFRCQSLIGDKNGAHTDGPVHRASAGYHRMGTQGQLAGGAGAVMGNSRLNALTFFKGENHYTTYVNFAIFRNYL